MDDEKELDFGVQNLLRERAYLSQTDELKREVVYIMIVSGTIFRFYRLLCTRRVSAHAAST
jgi:hypothetical protein